MIKKIILILVFLLLATNVFAILPPDENPGLNLGPQSWSGYACWYRCELVRDQICLSACSDATWTCERDEFNVEHCTFDREAYGKCAMPCHIAAGACVQSCKIKEFSGREVSYDNFKELEEVQGCKADERDSNGCCEGYGISDFGVCCKNGFTARKNDNGVYCDMDVEERTLKNIIINVNSLYDYEENEDLDFSMKFEIVDGNNKKLDSANIAYPGQIVVEPQSQDLKNKLSFSVDVENPITDSNGMIGGKIKVNSASLSESSPSEIKVDVYNSELPNIKKSFTLKTPDIKIIDVVKLEKKMQWQDSWATYEVKVFDPYNSKKNYVLGTNDGILRIDGVEYGDLAHFTTKENSLKFAWKAPKLTKDMRLNYATKVVTTAVDLAIKKAEGGKAPYKKDLADKKSKLLIKERLHKYANQHGADLGDELSNIQKSLESLEDLKNTVTGVEQGEALLSHITNMEKFMKMGKEERERLKKNPDMAYAYARMALQSATFVEGLLGQFGINSFPASATLAIAQSFFEVTDEMNEIAASRTISKEFNINARVESKKGVNNFPKTVKVEGYEMVLKEEKIFPLR